MEKNEAARDEWPQLMALAQSGDSQAYTRLLKALVPVIRSLARKHIADEELVEDVIQDVLLTVHRVRHTYDPGAPFLPWLMAIANARAVDALRKRGRHQQREIASETDIPLLATSMEPPSHDELAVLLNQLPARQREVVEHVHLREMTLAETATQQNLTVAAVKSLLHRALSNLRRLGAHHGRS
ncbi:MULTISPECIES: sigma-70 family RNA polymerase sigma factor [Enterobacteriaceae]|uniref:sigma-70 family RNA polymerase sigma factor n=1 Tax=Enterobacteriaceae TaxID=543 RepID=UPI00034EF8C1|nr:MULTISPECIES: sigma-70 family RNA polymerase sigma factor [Enterobacteriaceae]AGN85358.1 RNA polymerase sigma70 factor [Enterobacter sp. R4-368]MCZ3383784.1 sigma-70 family RNA polymerase sigma factor [Kosakonia sp. SOY2]PDO81802.1 RNA polymerase subunit sigma-70 [Kosakonia sacchari]